MAEKKPTRTTKAKPAPKKAAKPTKATAGKGKKADPAATKVREVPKTYPASARKVNIYTLKGSKKGVLPASALAEETGAGTADRPARRPETGYRARAREVDDFLYKSSGYQRIECPCGAVLKTPPKFAQAVLTCPRCGAEHSVR